MSTLHVKLTASLLALTAALPSHASGLLDAERWTQKAQQWVQVQEVSELFARLGGGAGVTLHPFFNAGSPSAGGEAAAPDEATPIPQGKEVSLEFRGPLSQAIREIARQGGLSVIVQGGLDQEVQVNLHGLSAGQVLEALAQEHALTLAQRHGLIVIGRAGPRSGAAFPAHPAFPPPPPIPPHFSNEDARRISDEVRQELDGVRKELDGVRIMRLRAQRDGRGDGDLVVTGRSETVPRDRKVNDVLVYGGSLDLEGEATGNVLVFGGDATIPGVIQGDALVFGGQMRVEGTVLGDILVMGGNVDLGSDADVRGSVRALGGRVNQADGAQVQGANTHPEPRAEAHGPGFFSRLGSWLGTLLTRFVLLFGLGFLAFMLFPARMRVITEDFKTHPGSALGLGFFAMLALVPFIVLLCITIVGIPVALLLIPLVPLAVAMGVTAIALELGRRIPLLQGPQKTQASALALGLIPLVFISTLPVVGPLMVFLLSLVALGSVVRTRVGGRGRDPLPTTID
ncbi:MAG TPA: hypothetical protein VK013_13630 [Myxococcaceae bacterium]|nr:hypothetical protein [Myxococcaceae bacterium]